MKSIKTLLATALLLVVPAMFTSCDDDYWYDDQPWYGDDTPWWWDYGDGGYGWNNNYYNNGGSGSTTTEAQSEAEVLAGEWEGSMSYTNGDDGSVDKFYANMTFARNNSTATKGTGTELDYTLDSNGNINDQQVLKFDWYIDESTLDIYVRYLTNNSTTFVMDASAKQHGFNLIEKEGVFSGYMIGTNNNDLIQFDFKRVNNTDYSGGRASAKAGRSFGSTLVQVNTDFGTSKLTTRR